MRLPRFDWPTLERIAESVVEQCISELPDELREGADRVPCLYRHYHPNAPHIDPEAMYMLGEYISNDGGGGVDESGVIVLYLGALKWYCEDEDLDFEDEVRTTYLHELGHHFGWDEEEVEQRGL
ncbi:metallopeptidase family protein [Pelagicoccus sp. SDUM812003]|uniref:metallopeptidase family protein n=1 Tax=Pelagicoccus sp. SDUM812003 TaxID=3041267 RepID=UPI00280FB0A8|nr:metallopeptidase family protein [Pelagicoccus sp. SDUM812003]MDQ8202758.1 metallopeptidase family protein [Pelagicoccus sp. SDUM812003]